MTNRSYEKAVYVSHHTPTALTVAGILLILLAFTPPVIPKSDGSSMFAVAESIVTHGKITVPPDLGRPGHDGRYYSPWYPLLSLVLVPFAAAGRELARTVHLPVHYLTGSAALLCPSVLITGNAFVTIALALRLGTSIEGAMWAGLAFVFGTFALADARELQADPLLALITVSAIYLTLLDTDTMNSLAVGGLCILAVLAKPSGLVLGPVVSTFSLLRRRGFVTVVLPIAGTLAGSLMYLAYNWYRFGNSLDFGQPAVFSITNVPAGLAGQLISPGHGLFWYCPAVLALGMLPKSVFERSETTLIVGTAAVYLIFYAAWRKWDAGWCWGPRFLIAGLPGLMALTGLLNYRARRWLIALTFSGIVITAPTLVSYYGRVYVESYARGVTDTVRDWSPKEAPIAAVWSGAYRTIRVSILPENNVKLLVHEAGAAYHTTADEMPGLKVIALWWWMLPVVGIPLWVGGLLGVGMIACGTVLIFAGLRAARKIDNTPSTSSGKRRFQMQSTTDGSA